MTAKFNSRTVFPILFAVAFAHLCNDLIQAVIPAMYPILKERYSLSLSQIGVITFCFQIAASIFQPVVGSYTDKKPQPFSQLVGMAFSGVGLILLSFAPSYAWILLAVILVGVGSSIFHPESSRVAYAAAGGRRSLAQAIFQIGGNMGAAFAPLLIAVVIIPNDQRHLLYFLLVILLANISLFYIGSWYKRILRIMKNRPKTDIVVPDLSKRRTALSVIVLLLLIFSKYFYTAAITSYFQFYTIHKFSLSPVQAQVYLFYYLFAAAVGTLVGGIFGDRLGRKNVIWFSILGTAPFALMLPYVGLQATAFLIVIIGFIISSAFPSILVYAQELLPRKIGMVSGLFYGFAFGMGGLGSAVLGRIADLQGIEYVYELCSYLPLIGLITFFLPDLRKK